MISTSHNFLFIHIPKTAGNSITEVLLPYVEDEKVIDLKTGRDGVDRFELTHPVLKTKKHTPICIYKWKLGSKFRKMKKVACIRNPWDRLISMYFFKLEIKNQEPVPPAENFELFSQIVKKARPMCAYLTKSLLRARFPRFFSPKVEMDFIVKFENLNDDFNEMQDLLGLEKKSLPVRNASKRGDYRQYYNDEMKALVEKYHGMDLKYFKYSF